MTLGHPSSIALTDLNGDGFPDIVVCFWAQISILLGSSTGTFSYGQVYDPAGVGILDDVATADVNEDGLADLAVVAYYYGLFIMEGNGDGTFDAHGPPLDGNHYTRVDVDDIDEDGHLDLLCPCPARRGVSLFYGDGTGGGEARHSVTGGFPYSVASGDLDGDGKPDLASASWSGDHVSILLNDPYDPATLVGVLACEPESGVAPFDLGFSATLTNTYSGSQRLAAGRIDVKLAGGQGFGNWRSGYITLDPGASRISLWNLTIPAAPAFIGDNRFSLTVEDVTPPPYNHPPYPAAGRTDRDGCTVTALMP